MKATISILSVIGLWLCTSCKEAKLQVQNNVSNARIQEVYWGDFSVAAELLPGETSEELTISKSDEDLPSSHRLKFVMYANQRKIYLETKEEYYLNTDDHLLIKVNDGTPVSNPN